MSADAFLDLESSVESSMPRELFEIVQNATTTYRITSGSRDITYAGNKYVASPVARTEMVADTVTNQTQLTIALPLSHPLAQRYVAQGSPPRQVTVTVYRQQPGGLIERFAGGVIVSMGIERHIAKFAVQSNFSRILSRSLPVLRASKLCPHVLYDANCQANRPLFTIDPCLVTSFDGRVVHVTTVGGHSDQWAQNGELVHVPTGERMTILSQIGTTITMQAAIPELTTGDSVTIAAGCDHTITTCRTKFSNRLNFGGFPELPEKNPFLPTGLGVVEQS